MASPAGDAFDDLAAFATGLGFTPPKAMELYRQAMTHSSYTNERNQPSLLSYERLEFLGDAVLKLEISRLLLDRFPDYREGDLTKIRAVLVSDVTLAVIARDIGIQRFLALGESERRNGGAEKTSTLACAFEAFLGALYEDGKAGEIQAFLARTMNDIIDRIDADKTKDNYKAALQEQTQAQGLGLPAYETVSESGPAHRRLFTVQVKVDKRVLGQGSGHSKKEAQQQAAQVAYRALLQQT